MNIIFKSLSVGAVFFLSGQTLAQKVRATDTVKTKTIDEVIMVGFGQKKAVKELTGSVGTISSSKLADIPAASVDQQLAGKVAGVQMGMASGQPGSLASIRIRGRVSVNGNNSPIVIVDGVRVNSGDLTINSTTGNILSSLNMDDIENVTFLKDAVSTAIYGADAGAGVMIITTKSGHSGRARFSADFNSGFAQRAIKPYGIMSSDQFKKLTVDATVNQYGPTYGVTAADLYDPTDPQGFGFSKMLNSTLNTNWRDLTENKAAYTSNLNFGVNGGNDKTNYYTSLNYFTQDGIVKSSDFKRLAFTNKINYKATDKLDLGVDFMGSFTQTHTLPSGGYFSNPIMAQYFLQPTDPATNADGSFYYPLSGTYDNGLYNNAALLSINAITAKTARLFGNFRLGYKILDNLKYRLVFAPEYVNIEEDDYRSPLHGDGRLYNGQLTSSDARYFNFNIQNILNYTFNIQEDHKFDINVLQEAYKSDFRSVNAFGVSAGAPFLKTLDGFVKPLTAAGGRSISTRSGYGATLGYKFKDFFNLDLSYRRDAVSNYQPGQKAGDFWSAGAGLDLASIGGLKNNTLSMAKLRGSYGKVGNLNTASPYSLYKYSVNYNDLAAAYVTGVNNPNLTWEVVYPLNVGVDLGFLNNRITLTGEYFNKKTTNLVFALPLSEAEGQGSMWQNVGDLVNKGFEVTLNADVIKTHDFLWNVGGNFSTLNNKMVKLYGDQDIVGSSSILREGEPVNAWYMRKWAGVDPSNGDPLWYVNGKDGATTNNYSLAQKAIQGSPLAKYYGGINTLISYKGFSVDAQMSYSFGNKMYISYSNYLFGDGAYAGTYPGAAEAMDYWTPDHTNATNPKPLLGGNKSSRSMSTRFLKNADFWRLRTLKVSYTFDNDFISKTGLNNFTVYLLGNNIWTHMMDKTLHDDPDLNFLQSTNLDLPPMKSYIFGVKFNF